MKGRAGVLVYPVVVGLISGGFLGLVGCQKQAPDGAPESHDREDRAGTTGGSGRRADDLPGDGRGDR